MKKIKNLIYNMITFCLIAFLSACNYLDVSKELAENLTMEEVFENVDYTRQWHANIFNVIPDYSERGKGATNGFSGIWDIMAGQTAANTPDIGTQMITGFNTSNASFHRWATCYRQIRQAMIFLANAKEYLGNPGETKYISIEEMNRMKAEANYMIAYSYFLLFELYGPVPIVTEIEDPENEEIDYARASVDELVNHIDGILQAIIDSNALPETLFTSSAGGSEDYDHNNDRYNLREIVRPTKVAAMALRARLWVYAASPLFNGGFEEALSVTNKDGKRLFPNEDRGKWQAAKQHLETLLTFAESNGHKLYYAKPESDGSIDPNLSIYELFQYYNDEILWANGNNSYRIVGNDMEARTNPRDLLSNGFNNVGTYQESVDAFFMANGLHIKDQNSGYREDGFGDLVNVCNSVQHVDKHIFNMYHNREPRFYASVAYEGKSWHLPVPGKPDFGCYFSKGGGSDNGSQDHPQAGYLLYKFKHRKMLNQDGYVKTWARPWILFRLADFYLYYAEVCNEINPGDPRVIEYIDKIRDRAGIPGYQELANAGMKNITGDYEQQKLAIQRERRVELFAEGNCYFDVHRWMTCADDSSEDQQKIRTGMDLNSPAAEFDRNKNLVGFYDNIGDGSYYNRTVIENRSWTKAMLLYPVPYNELQKSKLLVQNPLWN